MKYEEIETKHWSWRGRGLADTGAGLVGINLVPEDPRPGLEPRTFLLQSIRAKVMLITGTESQVCSWIHSLCRRLRLSPMESFPRCHWRDRWWRLGGPSGPSGLRMTPQSEAPNIRCYFWPRLCFSPTIYTAFCCLRAGENRGAHGAWGPLPRGPSGSSSGSGTGKQAEPFPGSHGNQSWFIYNKNSDFRFLCFPTVPEVPAAFTEHQKMKLFTSHRSAQRVNMEIF